MIRDIPITDLVDNPFQPRSSYDRGSIRSLAAEIAAEGFWAPLQGRRTNNGKVQLVFGHRRLRALRLLKDKYPTVKVDLVDLTDEQMALRTLEENLQREGLTELEKADGIRKLVEMELEQRKKEGIASRRPDDPVYGVIRVIANRLGFHENYVGSLWTVSTEIVNEDRAPIEAGQVSAHVAVAAKRFGGRAYLRTLARQGKQAQRDGSTSKPTKATVHAMQRVVKNAPEPVREKLKELIVSGEVETLKEAEAKARQLAAARARREKPEPEDLRAVIVGWTHRLDEWEQQMREVKPYMEYVEEVPAIAERFRKALEKLITTAKDLL